MIYFLYLRTQVHIYNVYEYTVLFFWMHGKISQVVWNEDAQSVIDTTRYMFDIVPVVLRCDPLKLTLIFGGLESIYWVLGTPSKTPKQVSLNNATLFGLNLQIDITFLRVKTLSYNYHTNKRNVNVNLFDSKNFRLLWYLPSFQPHINSAPPFSWHPCADAIAPWERRLGLGLATGYKWLQCMAYISMDWFKGKSTGNNGFYHQIKGFPVKFPIIQFYEYSHK
jgi:hypothetical protein